MSLIILVSGYSGGLTMQGDAETAEEELLRRVKAELEQPVEVEVIQTPTSYYHQNKDKVHTLHTHIHIYIDTL